MSLTDGPSDDHEADMPSAARPAGNENLTNVVVIVAIALAVWLAVWLALVSTVPPVPSFEGLTDRLIEEFVPTTPEIEFIQEHETANKGEPVPAYTPDPSSAGGKKGSIPRPRDELDPYPDLATTLDPVCAESPVPERACPDGMVFVDRCGGFCIDAYEASRGASGQAVSRSGAESWTDVDWFEARAACAVVGKRLCKDHEWMAACGLEGARYHLVDEEVHERHGCNTDCSEGGCNPAITGTRPSCRSDAGAYDLIGNVWEWTDALVRDASWFEHSGTVGELLGKDPERYGDDALYRKEVAMGNAFLRGGGRFPETGESRERGCFTLSLGAAPTYRLYDIGFRCCAEPGEELPGAAAPMTTSRPPQRPPSATTSPRPSHTQPRPGAELAPYPNLAIALDPECSEPVVLELECPEGMVFINKCGGFCIDTYEASRGEEGRAISTPEAGPWTGINWSDAKAACAAGGKRLCKDHEWMAACDLGGQRYFLTEEENLGNETFGCYTFCEGDCPNALTGAHPRCRSERGVFDMVGNVYEWTDTVVPSGEWLVDGQGRSVPLDNGYVGEFLDQTTERYGDDYLYFPPFDLSGRPFLRGGSAAVDEVDSPDSGCFFLTLDNLPEDEWGNVGFRCCADPA